MGYIVRRKCSLQCTSCACHVDMSTYTIMRKPNPAASQHPCFSLFSFFAIFFECFQVRLGVFYMTIVGQLQSIETRPSGPVDGSNLHYMYSTADKHR